LSAHSDVDAIAKKPLGSLSPSVEESASANGQLYSVKAVTTSGEFLSGKQLAADGKTWPKIMQTIEITVADRPTADTVARYWSKAIQFCGGKARTAANELRAKEVLDSTQRSLGPQAMPVPEEVRSKALQTCEEQIRAQLTSPSSAKFLYDNAVVLFTDMGGISVFAAVDAANSLGGRMQKDFLCTLKSYGKSYVPETAFLLP
jgi:hypothetical protein